MWIAYATSGKQFIIGPIRSHLNTSSHKLGSAEQWSTVTAVEVEMRRRIVSPNGDDEMESTTTTQSLLHQQAKHQQGRVRTISSQKPVVTMKEANSSSNQIQFDEAKNYYECKSTMTSKTKNQKCCDTTFTWMDRL